MPTLEMRTVGLQRGKPTLRLSSSRSIETLSLVKFQDPRLPPLVKKPSSMRNCLRISVHMKLRSRVDQCRAEIIQALISLSETMSWDGPLSTYC